jgi:scyllo-inositol 2-dehydrogenase (NADP+)
MEREASRTDLKVAIIGYGMAGKVFHAPLVESTTGMRVAAIVTSNPARRQDAAADYPDAKILDSPNQIWSAAGDFDLVVVGTPNRFHALLATEAINHGLATVIDKPLATNSAEGRAVIDLAQKASVLLSCFQNRRWDGDFLTARKLLQENMLGPVHRFESAFERYKSAVSPGSWREETPWEEGGGLLWDLGAHLIDQARLLFGDPISVYAEMASRRPGSSVDDDTFVALTHEGGVQSHLRMGAASRIPCPRFRVLGLRGTYEKHGLDTQEASLIAGERPGDDGWGTEPESAWGRVLTEAFGLTVDGRVETLPGAYETFYAGIRDAMTAGTPLPVDPRDSLRNMEIIEAARKSATEKRVVSLPVMMKHGC